MHLFSQKKTTKHQSQNMKNLQEGHKQKTRNTPKKSIQPIKKKTQYTATPKKICPSLPSTSPPPSLPRARKNSYTTHLPELFPAPGNPPHSGDLAKIFPIPGLRSRGKRTHAPKHSSPSFNPLPSAVPTAVPETAACEVIITANNPGDWLINFTRQLTTKKRSPLRIWPNIIDKTVRR